MDVFILHTLDKNFLNDLAIDDRLFMDENGNYWCAINHANENEFKFNRHLLKKVQKTYLLSRELVIYYTQQRETKGFSKRLGGQR